MAEYGELLKELRDFRQESNEKLGGIKEDIAKVNSRIEEAEGRIEKTEERMLTVEEIVTELVRSHTKLADKLTDFESQSRRQNIRIYGVPEESEHQSPTVAGFVERLLRDGLQLDQTEDFGIERAHRSLGPIPPSGASPRSIVVKFLSFKTKEKILRKAWQQRGITWNEKRITLDNDYPPSILKKRREYTDIRKTLKDNQIQFQTLFPARLKVKYANGEKTYNTAMEASQDMSQRGFPVTVIKSPETIVEQLKQLTWSRVTRGTGRTAANPEHTLGYKEKLRAFKRATTEPSGV